MVTEIRIYVEGGGDGANTKALIKGGFNIFLKELCQIARRKQIEWNVIMCGSREHTFRNFKNALKTHPDAFNVLLVDSEAPVNNSPWEHLKLSKDKWDSPGVDDTHCHLMVQSMEAWLIADIDALKKYYGQGFKENVIPKNQNVEEINKDSLEPKLKTASRETTKGEYKKIKHAAELLRKVDVAKVRKAAPHCDRFFTTLAQKMDASI